MLRELAFGGSVTSFSSDDSRREMKASGAIKRIAGDKRTTTRKLGSSKVISVKKSRSIMSGEVAL